jgi:hypothetical protein
MTHYEEERMNLHFARSFKLKILFLLMIVVFAAGCAEVSPILNANETKSIFDGSFYGGERKIRGKDDTGAEKFRLHQQGATGFVPRDLIKEECEQRATEFCQGQGKVMKVLEETISSHAMTGPGNFPRVELVFICLEKKEEIAPLTYEDQTYIRLSNLKKLLDNGTLTKDEFEQEKAKILNK